MLDESMHKQAREILSSELFWPKVKEPAIEINGREQILFAIVEHVTKEQLAYIAREAIRLYGACVRARLNGLSATLTLSEWLTIIHRYQGLCAYCRQKPFEEIEHMIPISLGGGTTAENCVPACQKCNLHKLDTKALQDEQGNLFIREIKTPRERTMAAKERKVRSPMGTLIHQARKENPRPIPPRNPRTGLFTRAV